jgi:thiamine-phosphate pyrophosphorylase
MTRSVAFASTLHGKSARRGRSPVRGLYAITPDEPDTATLVAKVGFAIAGGARLVQYRNKSANQDLRRQQAAALLEICRRRSVPLVINDDLDLAVQLDADGVHLGRSDGEVAAARRRLAAGRMLGASCYDQIGAAVAAVDAGADYVAFGAAFPTAIKPGAPRASLALYAEARTRLDVPIVAIGGITPKNAASLVAAGADAVAVIRALFDARDIEYQAREFCRALA